MDLYLFLSTVCACSRPDPNVAPFWEGAMAYTTYRHENDRTMKLVMQYLSERGFRTALTALEEGAISCCFPCSLFSPRFFARFFALWLSLCSLCG